MTKKKQNIIYLVLCLFSMAILAKQFDWQHYSIVFIIMSFFVGYFLLTNEFNLDKRKKKYVFFLSLVSSLILAIGSIYIKYEFNDYLLVVLNLKNLIKLLIFSIADYIIFYFLFAYLFANIENIKIISKKKPKLSSKKVFWGSFIIIFICYIPYFLRCYPALMSPDSFVQINTIEQGVLSNHHPLVQTYFFGSIYAVGKMIFGPGNLALAFYTIIQMIIIALVFSYTITFLYKKGVNKYLIILVLLFYALSPLHGYYSVTLWKDILFSVNFLVLTFALININEKKLNIKNLLVYIISILVLLFFRNNGIIVFIFMIPFMFFIYKNNRKLLTCLNLLITIFYFVITGPVYNHFNVLNTKDVEAFSVPLQQIARVISLDKEIDDESKEFLEELFEDYDEVKEAYLPYISDSVKNSVNFDYIKNHKLDLIKVWFKILWQHPRVYIDAYIAQTLGYWYPDTVYHAISYPNCETPEYNAFAYGITNKSLLNDKLNKMIDYTAQKSIPYSNLIWGTGLYCYLVFVFLTVAIYMRKSLGKNIIVFIPIIGLWVTMMLGTPVFAELRYIYGIFVCMPVLLLIPFIKEKKDND